MKYRKIQEGIKNKKERKKERRQRPERRQSLK